MARPAVHPCGTKAAYARHKYRGEEPCQPCKDAYNEYLRTYRKHPDGYTRKLKPCGTTAAYYRHLRHGEQPCRPCKDAIAAHTRATGGGYQRARGRALSRLAETFPNEYEALRERERNAEPDRSNAGDNRVRNRALRALAQARDVEYQVLLVQEMDAEQEDA